MSLVIYSLSTVGYTSKLQENKVYKRYLYLIYCKMSSIDVSSYSKLRSRVGPQLVSRGGLSLVYFRSDFYVLLAECCVFSSPCTMVRDTLINSELGGDIWNYVWCCGHISQNLFSLIFISTEIHFYNSIYKLNIVTYIR